MSKGGLGLTTLEIGIVQGTIGVLGLTIGGILGGIVVSRGGWKRWFWPMVWSISLPNIIYVFLAYYQPTTVGVIATGIFIEQFGYGFGFTAYMLYLMSFRKELTRLRTTLSAQDSWHWGWSCRACSPAGCRKA